MQRDNTYFLIFHTIHDVLRVEKILKKQGFTFELVPVPRNLSSDCGSCIKLNDNIEDVKPYIQNIELDKCVLFDGVNYKEASDRPWK